MQLPILFEKGVSSMKRFYSAISFFVFVFALGVTPAFASLTINVGAIDRFSDGADVSIAIYEDGIPVAVYFNFALDDDSNVVSEGSSSTNENGEAILEFSGLSSDTYFTGKIWIGDDDDPEASQTFSFSTDSSLEEKTNINACNIGGIGLICLALIGVSAMFKKKR
jgi:hypothetical protein